MDRFGPILAGRFDPHFNLFRFLGRKVFLASLDCFYAVLIGDTSFSGFPDLLHAVFIDNKSLFLT